MFSTFIHPKCFSNPYKSHSMAIFHWKLPHFSSIFQNLAFLSSQKKFSIIIPVIQFSRNNRNASERTSNNNPNHTSQMEGTILSYKTLALSGFRIRYIVKISWSKEIWIVICPCNICRCQGSILLLSLWNPFFTFRLNLFSSIFSSQKRVIF